MDQLSLQETIDSLFFLRFSSFFIKSNDIWCTASNWTHPEVCTHGEYDSCLDRCVPIVLIQKKYVFDWRKAWFFKALHFDHWGPAMDSPSLRQSCQTLFRASMACNEDMRGPRGTISHDWSFGWMVTTPISTRRLPTISCRGWTWFVFAVLWSSKYVPTYL